MDYLTTKEAAAILKVKQDTLRESLCRTGGYYGVQPVKGVNGRLLWPTAEVKALIEPKQAEQ